MLKRRRTQKLKRNVIYSTATRRRVMLRESTQENNLAPPHVCYAANGRFRNTRADRKLD